MTINLPKVRINPHLHEILHEHLQWELALHEEMEAEMQKLRIGGFDQTRLYNILQFKNEINKAQKKFRELENEIQKDEEQLPLFEELLNLEYDSEIKFICNCKFDDTEPIFLAEFNRAPVKILMKYLCTKKNWFWFPAEPLREGMGQSFKSTVVHLSDDPNFSFSVPIIYPRYLLEDKLKICEIAPSLVPQPCFICRGKWTPEPSDDGVSPDRVWFLKDSIHNHGEGVFVFHTLEQALAAAKPHVRYVLQPHIADPLLYEGRKFNLRVYLAIVWHKNELSSTHPSGFSFYIYKNGWLCVSDRAWKTCNVSSSVQVSHGRSHPWQKWEKYDESFTKVQDALRVLCENLGSYLRTPPQKHAINCWEVFGVDFLFDKDLKPFLLECNSGPACQDSQRFMMACLWRIICQTKRKSACKWVQIETKS